MKSSFSFSKASLTFLFSEAIFRIFLIFLKNDRKKEWNWKFADKSDRQVSNMARGHLCRGYILYKNLTLK